MVLMKQKGHLVPRHFWRKCEAGMTQLTEENSPFCYCAWNLYSDACEFSWQEKCMPRAGLFVFIFCSASWLRSLPPTIRCWGHVVVFFFTPPSCLDSELLQWQVRHKAREECVETWQALIGWRWGNVMQYCINRDAALGMQLVSIPCKGKHWHGESWR